MSVRKVHLIARLNKQSERQTRSVAPLADPLYFGGEAKQADIANWIGGHCLNHSPCKIVSDAIKYNNTL